MPRLLLPTLVLAVMLGMTGMETSGNSLQAGQCNCGKCSAGRSCRACNGWGRCGCGKDGQRIPTLRQIDRAPGACCQERVYGQPDLFYNFYVDPSCSTVSAQMYPAPQPVPPLVGQTYITYQPLMPHEFLYPHCRTYHRYYNGGRGLTRTKVVWYADPLQALGECVSHALEIPR